MKIIGVTGHRDIPFDPKVLGQVLRTSLSYLANEKGYEKVVTGMALGFDMSVALVCRDLSIPYIAAVAYEGQEKGWGQFHQETYAGLLADADEVVYVCEEGHANWKYLERNRWIIDNSTFLMAYWSGQEHGGTYYTVKEAVKAKKIVKNVYHLVNP